MVAWSLTTTTTTTISMAVDHASKFQPIRRIRASDFVPSASTVPVLIEGAIDRASCERWCDGFLSRYGNVEIDVQRKCRRRKKTKPSRNKKEVDVEVDMDIVRCTLERSLDLLMQSSSRDTSFFAFCEGLLDDAPSELTITKQLVETLFDDDDWFQKFPASARPSDCVVLAGEGATSTLHRDPFEWTGLSLCLEGSKVWRFVEPLQGDVASVDSRLESYRLDSVAWGKSERPLSAGWQSEQSLFAIGKSQTDSARDLNERTEGDRRAWLESFALGEKGGLTKTTTLPIHGVVQHAGDILVIPAHWWHQTYACEPSVAVATQRCGVHDAENVVRHVLTTTGVFVSGGDKDSVLAEVLDDPHPVEALFRIVNATVNAD